MNFAFDEQQREFRAQFGSFLEVECTPSDVRQAFETGSVSTRRRWKQMADMGVVGLTVPEKEGGLGLSMVDLVGLLEEAGRACLPEPLAETSALVVPLLASDPGDASAASGWLQRIAGGEAIATVVIDGQPAVWADGADVVVVASHDRIVACDAGAAEVTPVKTLDASRREGVVAVSEGTVLFDGAAAAEQLEWLRRRGAVAGAAQLVGLGDRLIDFACEHARNRQQFGRPIGSFQAVKHLLATAFVRLEMARPCVYRAALTVGGSGPDVDRDCSIAKAMASEAALEAARVALQVHGAMGYTWEHDLHFWMKRVWAVAASWGDAPYHLSRILDRVSGGSSDSG